MSDTVTLEHDVPSIYLSHGFTDPVGPQVYRSRDNDTPYIVLQYDGANRGDIQQMLGQNLLATSEDYITFRPTLVSQDHVRLHKGNYLCCNVTCTEYFVVGRNYISSRLRPQ